MVLKFAKGLTMENKVDSLVVRLRNVAAPALFAVTWPKAIAPKNG